MPDNPAETQGDVQNPSESQEGSSEPENAPDSLDTPPEASNDDPEPDDERDTFDRAYVEKLRKENAEQRVKAKRADDLAAKLLDATIAASTRGILADATDLRGNVTDEADLLDDEGDPDPERIKAAARELVKAKPHLGDKRPRGEVDQGARDEPATVNLASMLRSRAG